ncbi:MAG TPA: hydantoinase B/oxoprolinase family protein [Longimicrobiaceae bacterium]|nr:hydantoinase B/oxoprolinase family protein [Longimicrobiaceae bacterium]
MNPRHQEFDAATLEILWSRLRGVCDEMSLALQRTAFSTIVSAALDFGCALLDAHGGQLAHATGSMSLFNLALPSITREVLECYGDDVHPGDVFIGNDPWLCCGHLPDVAVITPVFRNEQLVAFSTSVAHQADFGGAHGHNRVREVFEEGLFLPVMKLYERGVPNPTLFEIIRANVRSPEMVLGDINAQVVSNGVGAARLVDVLNEYEIADPAPLVAELQGRSEQAMRDIVRGLPDGTYRADGWSDSKGQPTKIAVAIIINGDEMTVDFEGTGPQLESGGTNCTLAYTIGTTHYELKSILAPNIPHNEGSTRPITVKAPKGSILNCDYPMAVNARVFTDHDVILQALAQALPEKVMAGPGLYVYPRVTGRYPSGQPYDAPMFAGGGRGGARGRDGIGGYIYPSSAANVSVELFEAACPAVVIEKEWLADTAGAGEFRGGPAQRITFKRQAGYESTVRMRYFPIRSKIAAEGVLGGCGGTIDEPLWNGKPVPPESEIMRDGWVTFRDDDDRLTIHVPSGGGFGEPEKRNLAAIQSDIAQELLTEECAARQYPQYAGREARG